MMVRVGDVMILTLVLVSGGRTAGDKGQSLAREKRVTTSSQHGNWEGKRITDGIYDRNGRSDCAATRTRPNELNPWMQIDLGKTTKFTRIVLYARTDDKIPRQQLNGLALHVDDKEVTSISSPGSVFDFYHFELNQTYTARTIKFVLKGTDKVLCLCEVDVFNDYKISLNKTTSSSSKFSDWNSSLAVDGLVQTADLDNCRCCAGTSDENDPWISVDLGDYFLVTLIRIHGRTDKEYSGQSYAGMDIQLDGNRIHQIPQGNHAKYSEVFPIPAKVGRHVKFILRGSGRLLVICEATIYGERVISIGGTTALSSQYSDWKAKRAVDGKYNTIPRDCNCCAATKYKKGDGWKPQYLRLTLGRIYKVSRIVIYGRTDEEFDGQNYNKNLEIHADGSKLIMVNDTNVEYVNFFAFQLSTEKIPNDINLTLLGSDPQLVVCELLVYGDCIDGYFGERCSKQCHCDGEACPTITGICPSGRCKPGYKTQSCSEKCDNGKYGRNCLETCGNCRHNKACGIVNGHCTECMDGYMDTDKTCKTKCNDGWYGSNCSEKCGNCRGGKPCDKVDGHCTECGDGYTNGDRLCQTNGNYTTVSPDATCLHVDPASTKTEHCSRKCCLKILEECDNRKYGRNCSETCGNCMHNEVCGIVNGHCTECIDGYMDTDKTCKTNCSKGTYGQNCSRKCGSCKDGETCNFQTGRCSECNHGYYVTDKLCQTSCESHMYGYNCIEQCGSCRNDVSCNKTNGLCEDCKDGYNSTDRFCKTECDNRKYGRNCSETCGNCMHNEVCGIVNGHCTECIDGYMDTDKTCKTNCSKGTYGQNCSRKCGSCKDGETCNFQTGRCSECNHGYYVTDKLCQTSCESHMYGYNCIEQCGSCRNDVSCNKTNGLCEDCKDGYNSTDRFCKTACEPGFFGHACKGMCGHCFGDEICNVASGSCSRCLEGYTGATCIERLVEGGFPTGIVIGVVLGLVGLVIVAVFFYRRRKPNDIPEKHVPRRQEALYINNETNNSGNSARIKKTTSIVYTRDGGGVSECEYYNFTSENRGVALHKLWDYIGVNKQNLNEGGGFAAEFKALVDGLQFAHDDALANRKKNRYQCIYPYDHSRVHLKVEREDEGDFINASHIDGYEKPRKFIASQGPIEVMVDDFWRMVWQQNVSKIVMLTNLVEAGKSKCMQYWPESGSLTYARITITLIGDNASPDYSLRTLEVKQDDEKPRRVTQYHFKAWPDKDVPDSTWSLVQFWREVCRGNNNENSPIIVHCSAGVGRTGTYIALDNLYNQATATGSVTPYSAVERLREQRIKMVQTRDQYVYLHEAVADALLFGTHYIWQSQFPDYYDFMIKKDKDKGQVRLRTQYGNIEKSLEGRTEISTNDITENDNLYSNEIDQYRPQKSSCPSLEVVKLPGISGPNSYLLSTYLDEDKLTECWELIDEFNVKTVITIVNLTPPTMDWSSVGEYSCGDYQPELISQRQMDSITMRTFTYQTRGKKSSNDKRSVQQLEMRFQVKTEDENQVGLVVTLLDLVMESHPHISTKEPVLIQCQNGITESGVVSVLLNERLRTIRHGGQINILDTVMLMKLNSPSCIANYSYYKYIHTIALHMLERKAPSVCPEVGGADDDVYLNM